MLTANISPLTLLGLLALSGVATAVANRTAALLPGRPTLPPITLGTILSDLIWALMMFAGLLLGVRYIERLPSALVGYFALGVGVFLLSVVRARLYHRAREAQDAEGISVHELVHSLIYLEFGVVLYVGFSLLIDRFVWPVLLVPLGIGSLLPELDSRTSSVGRLLPAISRRLEGCLGHDGPWHSLGAVGLVAFVTAPLVLAAPLEAWVLIPLGFATHLVFDTLRPQGTMLFWPFSRRRYYISGSLGSPGSRAERRVGLILAAIAAVLLLAADVRPPRAKPVVVASYEQSLERYDALRGRNLVYADVQGTWQATNRRVSARYEVLSAAGKSLVMLDRFTGRIFSAGRQAGDDLYLDQLTLVAGSAARVKPVEFPLKDQLLADVLPVVYEMQAEPGLQHIYVSGEILLSRDEAGTELGLGADYSLTQLRRVVGGEAGQYFLHYLTASELIALADLSVQKGELVIVATYASPAAGPTLTPLPTPRLTPEPSRTGEEAEP